MSATAVIDGQMELPIAVLLERRGMLGGRLATPSDRPAERQYERARSNSLPEQTRYRDDGCEVSASCLSCPLPRCRYDEPGGLRGLLHSYRARQMAELRMSGVPVETIAERYRVSRRTVFRILGVSGNQRREARCA